MAEQEQIKRHSISEKGRQEKIFAGYLFSFFGGLLGCFIGWHLTFHKKELPNGEREYTYSENDRKHGKNILFLGIAFTILWVLIRINTFPEN